MNPLIVYAVGLMGCWVLQDAWASICFYPNENWRWNHTARMIRLLIGLALIVICGMEL